MNSSSSLARRGLRIMPLPVPWRVARSYVHMQRARLRPYFENFAEFMPACDDFIENVAKLIVFDAELARRCLDSMQLLRSGAPLLADIGYPVGKIEQHGDSPGYAGPQVGMIEIVVEAGSQGEMRWQSPVDEELDGQFRTADIKRLLFPCLAAEPVG